MSKESFLSTYQTVFGGSAENADKVFTKLDKDESGDVTAEKLFDLFGQLDTEGMIDWYLTIIAQAFAYVFKESNSANRTLIPPSFTRPFRAFGTSRDAVLEYSEMPSVRRCINQQQSQP